MIKELTFVKVGDLITAYRKGFHVVTGIINQGSDVMALIKYRTVMDSKFNLIKSKKEETCSAYYCTKVKKEDIEKKKADQVKHFIEGFDRLLSLLDKEQRGEKI